MQPPSRPLPSVPAVAQAAPSGLRARADQPSSIWSVIVRAQGAGPESGQALGQLIRRYDKTVLAMIRAQRHPPDQSPDDLKQQFFLGVLRRGDIHKLKRERGRFRSWLHTAVRNFVHNEWESWFTVRSGRRVTATLPFQVQEDATPEQALMRQFAEDTLLHALQRQREESDDKERFDLWARFLPGPQLDIAELGPLAEAFGMSRNHVAVHIYTLRAKHKRVLREVVADTLDVDPADPEGARAVEEEMQNLYRLLCEAPRTQVLLEDA